MRVRPGFALAAGLFPRCVYNGAVHTLPAASPQLGQVSSKVRIEPGASVVPLASDWVLSAAQQKISLNASCPVPLGTGVEDDARTTVGLGGRGVAVGVSVGVAVGVGLAVCVGRGVRVSVEVRLAVGKGGIADAVANGVGDPASATWAAVGVFAGPFELQAAASKAKHRAVPLRCRRRPGLAFMRV